jgi:hypothetical protein
MLSALFPVLHSIFKVFTDLSTPFHPCMQLEFNAQNLHTSFFSFFQISVGIGI